MGSGSQREVLDEAIEGDFDLVVASQTGETPDKLRSWLLFKEPLNVLVPEGHRFSKKKSLTIKDLDGEALIERIDCCMVPTFRVLCEAAGVTPDVRHRATSEAQLQQMVLAGFGLAMVPRTLAIADGLAGVPLEGNVLERDVVLAAVAGRRFSLAADAFVKVARARDWSGAT
jgi:DNA-binding transcriptional LysR family regulator